MEQKITFEDGKLVLLTDNGKISAEGTTSEIHGEFVVSAENAQIIAKMCEGKEFVRIESVERVAYAGRWEIPMRRTVSSKVYYTDDKQVAAKIKDLVKKTENFFELAAKHQRHIDLLRNIVDGDTAKWFRKYRIVFLVIMVLFVVSGVSSLIMAKWLAGASTLIYAFGFFAAYKMVYWNDRSLQHLLEQSER